MKSNAGSAPGAKLHTETQRDASSSRNTNFKPRALGEIQSGGNSRMDAHQILTLYHEQLKQDHLRLIN
jgi:hypothetical protein